jgi:predicted kinase
LANLLDRRKASGKVRQCHGDLHLRNVCLFDGRSTLFDCIEFSDALACVDVLYDLAFLFMDLHHRRHDDLGSVVFNRYLDISGDTEGLPALPLFLSLRAAIRAHVTAASALRQSSTADTERQFGQAGSYLQLARQFLAPAKPLLVAIGGLSGSGKSSLAYGVAEHFRPVPGARVIRSDVLRKRLMGQAPEQRLPSSAYIKEMKKNAYFAMFHESAKTLDAGYTAILDATFLDPTDRSAVERLPRPPGVPFIGLWLCATPEILRQRVAARGEDASDADLKVLAEQLGIEPEPITWRRIDVSADYAGCVEMLSRVLSEEGHGSDGNVQRSS